MADERPFSAVHSDQLRILFAQAPIALAVNLIIATMMAAALAQVERWGGLALWLGLMLATVALRALLSLWYTRATRPGSPAQAWGAYSVLGSAVTGALWGLGGALLFPDADRYQMLVALTIAGMCAGAVAVNVSHFPTLLAFIVTAISPIAVRFALEGTTPDAMLAGMMIVFAVALVFAGYNFNRSIVETLRLRFDLARNARELEATNIQLREEGRQRRAAQDRLRRVEKLDALGRLTGGLAHDFNNLLQVVIGNLDLLKSEVRTDAGFRLLVAAHDGTERAAKLTHSLLAFARDQQLGNEVQDLNGIIEEFRELLHDAVGENATIDFALGSRPLFCFVDKTHFQTALLNLVLNAAQALPPQGGDIMIEAQRAVLSEGQAMEYPDLKPGPYVMVTVSDTGTGMSPEVLEHAFDPFYTTKEVGKGSGLGLSQVYGFAIQSRGSIAITSRPNEGTRVRMVLPAAKEPSGARAVPRRPTALERVAPTKAETANVTVLVVEDEPTVRSFVTKGVSKLGYRALAAPDGPSALRLLTGTEKIDLLLSDVMMPNGIRGDELAKQALKLRPTLKVLLMSGYYVNPGGDDLHFPFLQKPFSYPELAQTLQDILAAG